MKPILNKRGADIPSLFFTIISIFAIGIILFLFSDLFLGFYSGINNILGNSSLESSEAQSFLDDVEEIESSIWDYVFLGIFVSYFILMGVLAFATRTNIIFAWIYVFASLFSFVIGVVVSNLWQSMAENPNLLDTVARFPITNLILGNFATVFISVMIFTGMILLFGKASSQGGIDG